MDNQMITFLRESNNIEGVYDDLSLQQAIFAWEYCFDRAELTSSVILKTHKILMLHQSLLPIEKGYFRTEPVWVGGREALHYSQIREAIESWCMQVKAHISTSTPSWKRDHIQYEKIHPFIDGNGRTGRIFMNWQRHKAGLPILVIKASERKEYYKWFKKPESAQYEGGKKSAQWTMKKYGNTITWLTDPYRK